MPSFEQVIKLGYTGRQFSPQFQLIEVGNRHVAENKTMLFGIIFSVREPSADFVISLQTENRRDLQRPQLLEFFVMPRIGTENKVRQNATAFHERF